MVSRRVLGILRADRAGGEIADWVELVSTMLGIRCGGTFLMSGPGARLVVWACRASAVTLGPAVLFSSRGRIEIERRSDTGLILLAHELVHVRQFRERGFVRFLLEYGREYLSGRLRGASHWQAYRQISFEVEARGGEAVARRLLARGAILRGYAPAPKR